MSYTVTHADDRCSVVEDPIPGLIAWARRAQAPGALIAMGIDRVPLPSHDHPGVEEGQSPDHRRGQAMTPFDWQAYGWIGRIETTDADGNLVHPDLDIRNREAILIRVAGLTCFRCDKPIVPGGRAYFSGKKLTEHVRCRPIGLIEDGMAAS